MASMQPAKGKRVATVAAVLGIATIVVACIAGVVYKRKAIIDRLGLAPKKVHLADLRQKGRSVHISDGTFAAGDFLQVYSDMEGMTLIAPQDLEGRSIQVINPIQHADEEILRAILEVNGIHVRRETQPDGREVLRAEPVGS